jgi:hypothetical protein
MPCELGVFRRYLKFQSDDPGVEPEQVAVIGRIESLVKISGATDDGSIMFSPFPAARGAEKTLLLQSDVPGLELEVDTTRLPFFLEKPELKKHKQHSGGYQSWKLTLKVAPGKLAGRFPNPADPTLRDCAIYIKATQKDRKDQPPRSIRIPLAGMANIG